MHLRGRDMKMTATYPGGRQETLLNVPAYDFNWQLFYYPKHTRRAAEGHAPRSRRALRQLGGEQEQPRSHEADPLRRSLRRAEMMFGMFEFTAANGVSPKVSNERSRMTALVSSFPKDSAYLIEVPFGKEPALAVFHLPRIGRRLALLDDARPVDWAWTGAGS